MTEIIQCAIAGAILGVAFILGHARGYDIGRAESDAFYEVLRAADARFARRLEARVKWLRRRLPRHIWRRAQKIARTRRK